MRKEENKRHQEPQSSKGHYLIKGATGLKTSVSAVVPCRGCGWGSPGPRHCREEIGDLLPQTQLTRRNHRYLACAFFAGESWAGVVNCTMEPHGNGGVRGRKCLLDQLQGERGTPFPHLHSFIHSLILSFIHSTYIDWQLTGRYRSIGIIIWPLPSCVITHRLVKPFNAS